MLNIICCSPDGFTGSRKSYPQSKQDLLVFSMGTIIATLVLPQTKADFFIGEGYVKDPQAIVDFIKKAKNKDIILPPGSEAYAGHAPMITCPMLLIAGRADQATSLADAVARQAGNRKVVAFKGGHGMGFQALTKTTTGDLYVQAIDDFLK